MSCASPRTGGWLGRFAALPVRGYRRFISPLKPPTCRFQPTCSAYAIEALELHGLFRGTGLTVWRVLRCQPFCKGGFDPVPESELEKYLSVCDSTRVVDTPNPCDGLRPDSTNELPHHP